MPRRKIIVVDRDKSKHRKVIKAGTPKNRKIKNWNPPQLKKQEN